MQKSCETCSTGQSSTPGLILGFTLFCCLMTAVMALPASVLSFAVLGMASEVSAFLVGQDSLVTPGNLLKVSYALSFALCFRFVLLKMRKD